MKKIEVLHQGGKGKRGQRWWMALQMPHVVQRAEKGHSKGKQWLSTIGKAFLNEWSVLVRKLGGSLARFSAFQLLVFSSHYFTLKKGKETSFIVLVSLISYRIHFLILNE